MSRPLSRIDPVMPAAAYKTYRIVAPAPTHFREATCAEVQCPDYVHGWQSAIDERTDLGQQQAHYIRTLSGRRFREEQPGEGAVLFVFDAGQQCFHAGEHRVRIDPEQPPIYLVQDGDHRGNPRGTQTRRHVRAADWVDDFAEHQSTLRDEQQKG